MRAAAAQNFGPRMPDVGIAYRVSQGTDGEGGGECYPWAARSLGSRSRSRHRPVVIATPSIAGSSGHCSLKGRPRLGEPSCPVGKRKVARQRHSQLCHHCSTSQRVIGSRTRKIDKPYDDVVRLVIDGESVRCHLDEKYSVREIEAIGARMFVKVKVLL
jgi:hypothetical protein